LLIEQSFDECIDILQRPGTKPGATTQTFKFHLKSLKKITSRYKRKQLKLYLSFTCINFYIPKEIEITRKKVFFELNNLALLCKNKTSQCTNQLLI
jgi:hypothetical protein